ncbi:phosphotransferase KptA/Tpt1 [Hortaea werneckii]|nr:phosphotransferase KptA/Tpt1 [Hortaea werneckii]
MAGGRGGGRGEGRGPLPRDVQVSKKIAWLLRHGAEKEGLQMAEGGFINVQDVLNNRNIKSLKVSFEELRQLVADNDKKRFTMVPASTVQGGAEDPAAAAAAAAAEASSSSSKPTDWLIRANQGHSLKVDEEGLLKPITKDNMPQTAVHGSTHAAWPLIVSSGGLKPMTRNHVHFASGLPAGFKSVVDDDNGDGTAEQQQQTAAPVISGMRKSSTILIFLDLAKAIDTGMKFGISDNGVILSEGNAEGLIPLELFKRVEDRTGQGVLLEDGKVIKEAPASWAAKKGQK